MKQLSEENLKEVHGGQMNVWLRSLRFVLMRYIQFK